MDRGDLNNSPYVRHLLHTGTHADAPAYADDFPALHINLARMLRGVPRHTRLPSQVGLVLTCAACRATRGCRLRWDWCSHARRAAPHA